ncbi:MAG: hypothetical protein IKZ36_03495 [Kiritimatiellae bacterium]|nr:hypothetical protein [Kiritimatiellia bacterium]
MKNNKWIILVAFCVAMGKLPADGNIMIDQDLKIEIIEYLAPKCAESLPMVPLVDYVEGDTNQLLRILSTIIHTNNEWYCSRSMSEYGKYAGVSELPFLYSCATNPVCGWRSLDAIFRIEGVNSNSLSAVKRYLSMTNGFTVDNNKERGRFAEKFLQMIFSSDEFSQYRNEAFGMVYNYGKDLNILHVSIDESLMSADDAYKNSKRRLDAMRNSRSRCISDFLTNYVEGVIKELEKYPEEKLAD